MSRSKRTKLRAISPNGETYVFDSILQASVELRKNASTISRCMSKGIPSKSGWTFESLTNITSERSNQICKEYQVNCDTRLVTWFPKMRRERVRQLANFINKRLEPRWMTVDKRIAALEKQYLKEVLKSLI